VTTSFDCKLCKDTGWILNDDGYAEKCECVAMNISRNIVELAGINHEDKAKTFKNFEKSQIENINNAKANAIEYVKKFKTICNDRHNSICLLGKIESGEKKGVGTGKTHLGIAITNNLLHKGIAVRYFSYREEITKIKQTITDHEVYQRELNKWKNCKVLFVDDMFKGRITDSDINIMFEIINHRYLNRLPMIITSELDIDSMNNIDQAITSRLYEMSRGFFNIMGGKNANYRYQSDK
jgi:DNA replication protein DnaC